MPFFLNPFHDPVLRALLGDLPQNQQQQQCRKQMHRHKPSVRRLEVNWNVFESDDAYTIQADLPGARRDSLAVDVNDGVLKISARRGAALVAPAVQQPVQESKSVISDDADDWEGVDAEIEAETPPHSDGEHSDAGKADKAADQEQKNKPANTRVLRREVYSDGEYQRSVKLPDDADAEQVSAAFTDGMLSVQVRKLPHRSFSVPLAF